MARKRSRTPRSTPSDPPDPALFGHTIDALRPHPREPDRVRIVVERTTVATIALDAVDSLALAEGTPWTEELAERVLKAADEDQAHRRALRILSNRPRSSEELIRSLTRAGHAREAAARAVERLSEAGLLDDAAYARAVADGILRKGPAGPAYIRGKLRQRGIDPAEAETVARDALAGQDQLELALSLARRKARPLATRVETATLARRISSALLRRGFDGETARKATETVLQEHADAGQQHTPDPEP